jgi:plasmid maintenance system antidote protein VapI
MTPADLRALIQSTNLNNTAFARRMGLNPRSIRRMLSGEREITSRTSANAQMVAMVVKMEKGA